MAANDQFCLKWNEFETNVSSAFRELREDKDFFDVTLACDDEQIQAHKVILAACSSFFRGVLRRNRHEHPLLYLKGVRYQDLAAILNFMYHGEVNVAQEELNSFLTIAEDLKVKGLTQNNHENASKMPTKNTADGIKDPPDRGNKRARMDLSNSSPPVTNRARKSSVDDEIQEVVAVKVEPDNMTTSSPVQGVSGVGQEVEDPAMYEENYEEYDNYQETEEQASYQDPGLLAGGGGGNKAASNPSPAERDEVFQSHSVSVMVGGMKRWQCLLCGKLTKLKGDMTDHVECRHNNSAFSYGCRYCVKVLSTNKSLRTHEYKHRLNNQQGGQGELE